MERFFYPKRIALFGASSRPHKGGYRVLQNMKYFLREHSDRELYLIHPKAEIIEGFRCFKNLRELYSKTNLDEDNDLIDLAIVIVPVHAVMSVIKECIKYFVKGILIESGNLSENEKEAEKFSAEIRDLIKDKDIRIVGPNAIGFNVPNLHYSTPLTNYEKFLENRERNVSLVAQSGLFVSGFVEGFFDLQPFGVAKIAAIGNKIDVNENDILEYYLKDSQTHVIGMYLEDIKDGRRFLKIVKNARELKKPIVLLKAGKSEKGKKAIASHTGSLAGNFQIIEALSKQFRFYLVNNYEELFELCTLLVAYPTISGSRVGVISISGSGCVLSADYSQEYGLDLPEISPQLYEKLKPSFPEWAPIHNPIDTWASIEKMGPQKSYNEIISKFASSREFDALIILTIASPLAAFDWDFFISIKEKYPNLPLILHFFGGQNKGKFTARALEIGLPVVSSLELAFKFLSWMAQKTPYSKQTMD